jgi:hypothetical protein
MLLLISGCSGSHAPSEARAATTLYVEPNLTTITFYASYKDNEDKPYFNSAFRLHIDKSYIEDVSTDQFIEMKIPAGLHVFEVDELAWSGEVLRHSTTTIRVDPGRNNFIEGVVMPDDKVVLSKDDKIVLSKVDTLHGESDIDARTRVCLCE